MSLIVMHQIDESPQARHNHRNMIITNEFDMDLVAVRAFLADKEKLLITFSAGVAQMNNEETGSEAIRRADQAMYLAKRAGKNRVFAA